MSRSGDIFENHITGERAVIRQGTEDTASGNLIVDLYVRPGGAVIGEHLHPNIEERLTILSGEVGFSLAGRKQIATAGEAIEVPAGTVHDWWNTGQDEAHVLVEVNPGVRFEEMIVTFWGLANTGRTNANGMPGLLQLALSGREFADTVVFTRPPRIIQRLVFSLLAPLARRRGLRGSYPELKDAVLAHTERTNTSEALPLT